VIRAFGREHAVLFSTHILAEATLICRRVAIIDQGRLLAIDSPAACSAPMEQSTASPWRCGAAGRAADRCSRWTACWRSTCARRPPAAC